VDDSASEPKPAKAEVTPERLNPEEAAAALDWGDLYVTFQDVAGLKEVKNQINLRIIAPFKNPEIYRAFRRTGGGGIMLYGPPGCGKTFIARATAGECGARFMAVGIHEIVDKYWGESEKLMHALFEEARRKAPTVLFFDEFDALGSTRGRTESHFWKTLVDQLLQEMDGMAGRNDDVLIFAATNVPWNVDPAFRRPGRFDRVIFVPPPDEPARAQIIRTHSEKLPGGEQISAERIAKQTDLFTGADLKSLCERAAERALSRSLESGKIHPVLTDDFDRELKLMQSTAQEWMATARNYARYSNEGGQYDDLTEFLKRVKRW
jgi:SpoVK/Ycf46/Vps4 family AAA+-type ATPase